MIAADCNVGGATQRDDLFDVCQQTLMDSILDEFGRRFHPRKVVLAGGAVRDYVWGNVPRDYDVFVLSDDGMPSVPTLQEPLRDMKWHFDGKPMSDGPLVKRVKFQGVAVDICQSRTGATGPHALLQEFDWRICMYAYYDGQVIDLAGTWHDEGRLKLHDISGWAPRVLRRGYRFSERYRLEIDDVDLRNLCVACQRQIDEAAK